MVLNDLPHYSRVMLLQGPVGPFFWRLARFLRERGCEVHKVNFNGGDTFFYPSLRDEVFYFRDVARNWKLFIQTLLVSHQIEAIFLFGDCRFYHRVAIRVARRFGIRVYVFEEGYVRPDYFTLEAGGVNGFSKLPRDPAFFEQTAHSADVPPPQPNGPGTWWWMTAYAILYGLTGALTAWFFPYYRHHRNYFEIPHWLGWVRSWIRKPIYAFRQRKLLALLTGPLSKQYFLVPLQVQKDAQVMVHGEYRRMEQFIQHVMHSFATEAPKHHHLVIKHHPQDRGFYNYAEMITELARDLGIASRVHYIHDLHLPTLLDHARGTVVVNSTVGLSSILHGTPVKTHGQVVYNLTGLTHQGSLASFWQQPEPINQELHIRFRRYLIAHTQINGSFYSWNGFRPGRELATIPARAPSQPVQAGPCDQQAPMADATVEPDRLRSIKQEQGSSNLGTLSLSSASQQPRTLPPKGS